jgi:hypothetical protein
VHNVPIHKDARSLVENGAVKNLKMCSSPSCRLGTKEMLVISVLCGRTNREMDILKVRKFHKILSPT